MIYIMPWRMRAIRRVCYSTLGMLYFTNTHQLTYERNKLIFLSLICYCHCHFGRQTVMHALLCFDLNSMGWVGTHMVAITFTSQSNGPSLPVLHRTNPSWTCSVRYLLSAIDIGRRNHSTSIGLPVCPFFY